MKLRATWFAVLVAAASVCLLAGCGEQGPVRQEVTGQVFFKGEPLDVGLIDFFPLDGQGSKSGDGIENGTYRIPKDKGLFPGRYRVEILGGDGSTGAGKAEPTSAKPGFKPRQDRIPPKYNVKSELIIEVKNSGGNTFDFRIP